MNSKKNFLDDDLDSDFGDPGAFDDFDIDLEEDPQEQGKKRSQKSFDIELDRIQANKQVREEFDQTELNELAATLERQGLINPITVKYSTTDDKWIIIAGERRYRAAKQLGWTEITCVIKDENLTDAEFLEIQIAENTQRKNLNALEEAKGYQQMMDAFGFNGKQVAERLGVSSNKVNRSVRLLSLPADIRAEVGAGVLPKSLLREVQKLKSETEQRQLIEDYKQSGSLSDATKQVKQKKSSKKPVAGKTSKTVTINGIKLTAAGKKATKADIAAVLRSWADDLDSDGRGRRAA